MNFGGHILTGWLISQQGEFKPAERRAIMLAAIAPDIDGLFVLGPASWREWHRTFGHNVFWAVAAPLLLLIFLKGGRRKKMAPVLFLAMGSHFLLDLFVTGWWSLMPLWPVSDKAILMSLYIPENIMKYHIQIGLFIILTALAVYYIRKTKTTPVEILGRRADRFFYDFVTMPFRERCSYCNSRAFYRCTVCKAPLCGRHRKFKSLTEAQCKDGHS